MGRAAVDRAQRTRECRIRMTLWLTLTRHLGKAATVPLAGIVEPTADAGLLRSDGQRIVVPNLAHACC